MLHWYDRINELTHFTPTPRGNESIQICDTPHAEDYFLKGVCSHYMGNVLPKNVLQHAMATRSLAVSTVLREQFTFMALQLEAHNLKKWIYSLGG